MRTWNIEVVFTYVEYWILKVQFLRPIFLRILFWLLFCPFAFVYWPIYSCRLRLLSWVFCLLVLCLWHCHLNKVHYAVFVFFFFYMKKIKVLLLCFFSFFSILVFLFLFSFFFSLTWVSGPACAHLD
jgi:hypothetical protein